MKPNIIMILSDDQGPWSLGCYGNPEVKSPVLDEMARDGLRFENFFCTSPVCSPARASILSGKMPSQHGVLDWLGGGSVNKKDYEGIKLNYRHAIPYLSQKPDEKELEQIAPDAQIGFEETISFQKFMNYEKGGVPFMQNHLCYTELLKEHGYTCGLTGKWHLGNSYEPQKGFDYWEVIARGGTNYMMPEYIRDGKMVLEDQYVTDTITDDALHFLETNKDKPFYLSVHYTAPHSPWEKEDQPEEMWKLYDDCEFSYIPNLPLHPWQALAHLKPRDEQERRQFIQGFYSCITAMDRNIGRIKNYLEEHNMADNTLVIFLADNGFNLGHHGVWGKGNGTFPLNMYEESVKIPCIMWGSGVKKGAVCQTLASQYDLFPTILQVAGIQNKWTTQYMEDLPGVSLIPLMEGVTEQVRDQVVVYEEYGPVRMIREASWKLIYRTPYGPHELYNLEADPGEEHNLVDQREHQEIKNRLFQGLSSWFRKYSVEEYNGTQFPIDGKGQMERLELYGTGTTVFKGG